MVLYDPLKRNGLQPSTSYDGLMELMQYARIFETSTQKVSTIACALLPRMKRSTPSFSVLGKCNCAAPFLAS